MLVGAVVELVVDFGKLEQHLGFLDFDLVVVVLEFLDLDLPWEIFEEET